MSGSKEQSRRNVMLNRMSLYARIWSGCIQPMYERLRGKTTPMLEKDLLRSQWKTWEQIKEQRWRDFNLLLTHVSKNVPFYEDWFKRSNVSVQDVVQSRDLNLLPLVDRSIMVENPDQFRSRRCMPNYFKKTTGGTTGAPFSFLVNSESEQWRTAISRRGYSWAGCVPGRRQVHLWSSDVIALPLFKRIKRSLHRHLMNQYYISSFKMLRPNDLDDVLDKLNKYRPECMVVYPSSAEMLAKHILHTGREIRKKVVSIIGGGEAVFPWQREIIEKVFGCPLFETYGNREFMLIASECEEHSGLHISAENMMVEIVKDGRCVSQGETGEILVTDLHNYAQPFIRYRTGDISSWAEGDCPCKRNLPRLNKVEGRELDVIYAPGGRSLTGHFLPHFLQDIAAIRRFQVVQDRPDHVEIRVVLNHSLAERDRSFIVSQVEEILPGMKVEIREVNELERTASGKIRTTIGLVQ